MATSTSATDEVLVQYETHAVPVASTARAGPIPGVPVTFSTVHCVGDVGSDEPLA